MTVHDTRLSKIRPELLARFERSSDDLLERMGILLGNLRIPEPIDDVAWIEDNVRIPKAVSSAGGRKAGDCQ